MIHRLPFKEPKPSRNIGEAITKRTVKTKEVFKEVGEKSSNFASKLWKKIKNEKDDEEKQPDMKVAREMDEMSHDDF